jgi:hypothetical protein
VSVLGHPRPLGQSLLRILEDTHGPACHMKLNNAHARLANTVREFPVSLFLVDPARLGKLPAVGRRADDIKVAVSLWPKVSNVHAEIWYAAGAPIQADALKTERPPRLAPALILSAEKLQ